MPTQLASYGNKYMSTHISEKDIRAISSSYCEKDSKIGWIHSGTFIRQLKKISTLNQKKTLKGTQEKVALILGQLSRLWNIMETEWETLPDNGDEAISGQMEIATLFEQSIILVGQVFNVITYHRWLNILDTLIDNSKGKGNFERT